MHKCGYCFLHSISDIKFHEHLLKLDRFLMYEYMGNGSLKDHLHCMLLFPLYLIFRFNISFDTEIGRKERTKEYCQKTWVLFVCIYPLAYT